MTADPVVIFLLVFKLFLIVYRGNDRVVVGDERLAVEGLCQNLERFCSGKTAVVDIINGLVSLGYFEAIE